MTNIGIQELLPNLEEEARNGFVIRQTEKYVALFHPQFGSSVIVPSDTKSDATAAASDLRKLLLSVGENQAPFYFAVSHERAEYPWLIRKSDGMGRDLLRAMEHFAKPSRMMSMESIIKISALLDAERPVANTTTAPRELSPNILKMAESCVSKALGGDTAWIVGVPIGIQDIVSPSFLLPAILVDAALTWTLPVVAAKGEGGFLIRMTPDPNSVLGYRVIDVDAAAPVLLFLPFVNIIRRSFANGECILDGTLERFSDFLTNNGLDNGALEDVDVRVVVS